MIGFLQRWLVTTLAVLVAANLVRGIHYDSAAGLFVASLLLGVLNAFVRPIMLLLSLPLLVCTLGLFVLVINALLLYAVAQVVSSFHVDTFRAALWGGVVISLVSLAVNLLTGRTESRVQWRRNSRRDGSGSGPDAGGPVIDV